VALRWRVGAMSLVLLAALATVGTEGLRRFEGSVLTSDDSVRQQTFDATWQATKVFWPVGSGLGSFAAVYPRFQPAEMGNDYVEHAHSDYVQLLMETGVLGLLLGALVLTLLLAQARKLGRKLASEQGLRNEEQTMLAAGLGLLALLLHAWVDFNMRIPALAMLGAFLFGVFMRQRSLRHGAEKWE
jgi:O-antigen ligase